VVWQLCWHEVLKRHLVIFLLLALFLNILFIFYFILEDWLFKDYKQDDFLAAYKMVYKIH